MGRAGEGRLYPRAEVRYLPESLIADVPKIIVGLQVGQSYKEIPVPAQPIIRKGPRGAFHDKAVNDASHHAVIPNANTIDTLKDVWPRLSADEKKLFDVIARAYLAAIMPDFRFRQTVALLAVPDAPFRATGRQPLDLGWRAAFPDWVPTSEKSDDLQVLPMMTNGEAATLRDPKVEGKETRPPPRYNEGSLIEAMQNAWRFVEDAPLRERLKEAKGIGTPATRAEIINGLKRQKFLTSQSKNIVPTETGLKLFAVLNHADPTLVDPGATAQLEQLLDDVVAGRQQMMGAIDEVCQVADRIITKLKSEAQSGDGPILKSHTGKGGPDRPPTPAMKRFAMSLAREKQLHLPRDYATSIDVCRAFLEAHAPKKPKDGSAASGDKPPSAAQLAYAKNIAQADGITIPAAAIASSTAMSNWIEKQRGKKRGKAGSSVSPKKPNAQENHVVDSQDYL